MKVVLYTQRVEVVKSYKERRDCADQKIAHFIKEGGYLPVPIPNTPSIAEAMVYALSPVGVVLTGGNSLQKYGGDAPERDETEKRLLDIACREDIAVYGFCRGMQVIIDYFGGKLQKVEGHIAVTHPITGTEERVVNSYHQWGCRELEKPLKKVAWTEDGVIEAIEVEKFRIFGAMWHPEREEPFLHEDIKQMKRLFEGGR